MKNLLSIVILLCFICPSSSWGFELVKYQKPLTYKDYSVLSLIETSAMPADQMVLAAVDLNNDFIDEYLVRSVTCSKQTLCAHIIVAFMDKKPRIIGQFDAHQIQISDKKDYGIQQLIVYNEVNNDFATRVAYWRPYQFRYGY